MNKLHLTFLKPGLHTTVQDGGRWRYQAFGVPRAGFMDRNSAEVANWLVGNDPNGPVLEITHIGPEIHLAGRGQIALTGADFQAQLDGSSMPAYQTVAINGDSILKLGRARSGYRGYLAAGGQWEVTPWLGSCSASPQRPELITPQSWIGKKSTLMITGGKMITPRSATVRTNKLPVVLRVLNGPEYHQFSRITISKFLNQPFFISPQSNRMGCRLEPNLTTDIQKKEIISSGVVPGTIQLTHSGQLIILTADAQTSGGYPRLAHVITADLDYLAQLQPGEKIRFKLTSQAKARSFFL